MNRQFLEFVATSPECLDRGSYTVVSQAPGLQTCSSVPGNPAVAGLVEAMEADPATGARVRRVPELLGSPTRKREEPRPFSR